MRILSGKFKFKEIISEKKGKKNEHIRPTSSKVREAIFNVLNHGKFLKEISLESGENLIDGKVVVDLFCGTGILGFEAFSRGAEKIIFVDKNEFSISTAKKNAENLGIMDSSYFIKCDSSKLTRPVAKANLVFMDPPYGLGLVHPTLKSLIENDWLANEAIIVAEHDKKEEIKEVEGIELLDQRKYNNTNLSILVFRE